MAASFGLVTRSIGEDIPLVFDPPDDTTTITGATLALRIWNICDHTDKYASDATSPTLSAPTLNSSTQVITGLLPHATTANFDGKTFRVEVWRIDGNSHALLIKGEVAFEMAITP